MSGAEIADLFEDRSIRFSGGEYQDEEFHYRLLRPLTIEAGQRYPLLLFLHGADRRGSDNRAQLAHLPEWMARPENRRKFPCFLVAPQCRAERPWVETQRATDPLAPRAEPGPQLAAVMQILDDVLRNYPVDEKRLYLTGLSLGGYGSWDLGTRLAERWAAVAPLCGGGDDTYAPRLVGVPVWAWHGDQDDIVPLRKSQRMIEALRRAGGDPKFTVLAGVGHDCWTAAYTDPQGVIPWMFAQHKA